MANSERKAHCNKKKFTSLLDAQINLTRTVRKSAKKDPIVTGLNAYKCPYCNGFHIGKSMKKGIDWSLVSKFSTPTVGNFRGSA